MFFGLVWNGDQFTGRRGLHCSETLPSSGQKVQLPNPNLRQDLTWWLIPLSKWVITPVIDGISRVNPLITGVITHLRAVG